MNSSKIILSALLISGMLLFMPPKTARAATIDVTTTDDELNSDGDCSLREAIRAANTNTTVDACTAGSTGDDIINIPAGTYLLTVTGTSENGALTGDLDITDTSGSLTINGASAETTIIDGNATDRVFEVHSSATAVINNLTVQNGRLNGTNSSDEDGGGIAVLEGFVTLNHLTVQNNFVGDDTSPDGGGIYYSDNNIAPPNSYLIINNSTIQNNTSQDRGGGIYTAGADHEITIRNSTISGNVSSDDGGGIRVNSTSGILTIENSTIANNTAADNAGGLSTSGPNANTNINISNTIFANNINNGIGGEDCNTNSSPATEVINVSYSLIEDLTTCNLSGSSGNNVTGSDPNLAALADNGGPTPTHALQVGSLAIDHIPDGVSGCTSGTSTDQRGAVRADGSNRGDTACDMGAYEYQSSQTPTAVFFTSTTANPTATLLPMTLIATALLVTVSALWLRRRAD